MQFVWGPFAWNSTDNSWELPPGCFSALDYRRLSDMGPQTLGQRNFALFAARDDATFGIDHRVIGSGDPRDISLGLLAREQVQLDLALPTVPQASNLAQLAFELFTKFSDPDGSDMAMPLVPTTRRKWRVAMAGHAIEASFSRLHAAFPRLRDLMRRIYKRHYDAVQAGTLPPGHHRKWMGYQMKKYTGRVNDDLYKEFLHAGTPDESPVEPTTVVTDDFNDGNLTGWTVLGGTWANPSTFARNTADGELRYDTDLSGDDQYSEITQIDSGQGNGPSSAMCRKDSSATLTYYEGKQSDPDASVEILKVVNGTPTSLAFEFAAIAIPSTARLEVGGSALELFIASVSKLEATDSAITGNLRCGIVGYGGGFESSTDLDDFEAGDLVTDQIIPVGQAVETSSAFSMTRAKSKSIGQANEFCLPLVVIRSKHRTLGQPAEAVSALAVASVKTLAMGLPFETATALDLSRLKVRELAIAAEADSSLTIATHHTITFGQAEENDSVPSISTSGLLTDLVSYWALDENTGTLADDAHGVNNGTINGAIWTTGKLGSGLDFDGTDNVDCGSDASLDITGELTIDAWIYPDANAGLAAVIDHSNTSTSAENYGFLVTAGTTSPKLWLQWNNGGFQAHNVDNALTLGEWQHIAVTYDNGTVKFYRNGAQIGTTASGLPALVANTANVATLGRYKVGSQGTLDGKLDEIGLWGRALPLSEIQERHNGGSGNAYDFSTGGVSFQVIKTKEIGLISEADTSLAWSAAKSKEFGLALESETAHGMTFNLGEELGIAQEMDDALGIDSAKATAIGLVDETDTAFNMPASRDYELSIVEEEDSAQVIEAVEIHPFGLATETDTAIAIIPPPKVIEIGIPAETDTAIGMDAFRTYDVGQVEEADTAFGIGAHRDYAVGLATETDSAIGPIDHPKTKVLGPAIIELSTAFRLTKIKTKEFGLVSEADSALGPLLSSKVTTIGLAAEADTAFTIVPDKVQPVGLVSETDTALTVTRVKDEVIGFVMETDTAHAFTTDKLLTLGLASETDTAFAMPLVRSAVLGLATEEDTALGMTRVSTKEIGQPSETDTAQVMLMPMFKDVGIAAETDSAQSMVRDRSHILGQPVETDTAFTIVGERTHSIGFATETDTAQAFTKGLTYNVGIASESDSALAIGYSRSAVVGLASEADTAFTFTRQKTADVGLVTEADTAQVITFSRGITLGLPVETDTALSLIVDRSYAVGLATETDTAFDVMASRSFSVGLVTETDTATAMTAFKVVVLGTAVEDDTALTIIVVGGRQLGMDVSAWLVHMDASGGVSHMDYHAIRVHMDAEVGRT